MAIGMFVVKTTPDNPRAEDGSVDPSVDASVDAKEVLREVGQELREEFGLEPGERVRQDGLSDSEKLVAVVMHIWPVGLTILGPMAALVPLVLWLVQKGRSGFDDDHGREVINFGLSFLLLNVGLALTIIGVAFLPILWIYGLVSVIRGAVAAGQGEYFRYPMTFRFF